MGGRAELGFGPGDRGAGQACTTPKRLGASCSELRPKLLSLKRFPEAFLAGWLAGGRPGWSPAHSFPCPSSTWDFWASQSPDMKAYPLVQELG